jgi:hypothetical protein
MGHLEKCFNPEATSAMGAAFDSAWHELEASGSNFSSQFPPDRARETIAKRIIDMAQRGERDIERLSKNALPISLDTLRQAPFCIRSIVAPFGFHLDQLFVRPDR